MLILFASLAFAGQVDPLAPARDGLVQCYDPVPARKLCRAIGAYAFGADGSIVNTGTNRIQDELPVILISKNPVEVRDGKVCSIGPLTEDDIDRVEVAGRPLAGAALAQARAQIVAAFPPAMRTGSLCSAYTTNPDGSLTTTVDIGGVAHPDVTSTLLWVEPGEGWTVTP